MVLEKPVVVVSMNYRCVHCVLMPVVPRLNYKTSSVNAFGFLASQEVSNEGVANIGLQDRELLSYL
jgi:carboxylesterase type B